MKAHRIVVGVDGSSAGQRALAWAAREAAAHGGSVEVVTAFGFASVDGANLRYRALQRQSTERWLTELVTRTRAEYPAVKVTGQVVVGPPADVLAGACTSVDMLVLGSHGRGQLADQLFGSVAEHCIRTATCPVVVVPAADKPQRADRPEEAVPAGTGMPVALL